MKLKFKDYEIHGSPKEMAEFLRLTREKAECCLPVNFNDEWIKDFEERLDEIVRENFIPYHPAGTLPALGNFIMRPNRFD